MMTITNVQITPTGRVVPAYHQRGLGQIRRQLLINSRNWPVHLSQFDNESAEFTVPQPRPAHISLLEEGRRIVNVDPFSQELRFCSLTTGYCYPESDVGICNEPYHDQTEAPHGPSRRCTLCPTRLPVQLSRSTVQAGIIDTALPDGHTLPRAVCAKCVPLTTSILKLDYPVAFSQPTAPMCDYCTATYLSVRAGRIPDPTGLPPLNVPCQCSRLLNHLATGWVCYRCKLAECTRRTSQAFLDQEMHRGTVDGWTDKGILTCTYLCQCGLAVAGDHSTRKCARCVACERVVEREDEEGEREGTEAKEVVEDAEEDAEREEEEEVKRGGRGERGGRERIEGGEERERKEQWEEMEWEDNGSMDEEFD